MAIVKVNTIELEKFKKEGDEKTPIGVLKNHLKKRYAAFHKINISDIVIYYEY